MMAVWEDMFDVGGWKEEELAEQEGNSGSIIPVGLWGSWLTLGTWVRANDIGRILCHVSSLNGSS